MVEGQRCATAARTRPLRIEERVPCREKKNSRRQRLRLLSYGVAVEGERSDRATAVTSACGADPEAAVLRPCTRGARRGSSAALASHRPVAAAAAAASPELRSSFSQHPHQALHLTMDQQSQPPWRTRPGGGPNWKPASTIPSKRSADTQEEEWVAGEDRFVLQQAKKKAAIRVKGGRAKPIDWLAVTLRVIDGSHDVLDEDDDAELDIVDPEGVLESLDEKQMEELEKDIETYLVLENDKKNREFWNVCTYYTLNTRFVLLTLPRL